MPKIVSPVHRRYSRQQIDSRRAAFAEASPLFDRPAAGWVGTIRQSLGMTRRDLAKRMRVAESSVARLEASESAGTIQLDTLQRAAEALDCELHYVLVPRRPLEDMVIEQARKRAAALIDRAAHTMLLEDQKPSAKSLDKLLSDLTADRIDKPGLWDDTER